MQPLPTEVQAELLSIVFVGEFNPSIIHPAWLAKRELIGETEEREAKVEVVSPEFTRINLHWATLDVQKNRLGVTSKQESHFESIKDLVQNIVQTLRGTPVYSFGINHHFDLDIQGDDEYYGFGNTFAPLNQWKDSFNDPRMNYLEIIEQTRKDKLDGKRLIRIYNNNQREYGVHIHINDHYRIDDKALDTNLKAVELLKQQWEYSRTMAREVVKSVLDKTRKKDG